MSKWVLICGRYFNTDQIVAFMWDKEMCELCMMLPDGNEITLKDELKTWYGILCRAVGVKEG